MNDRFIRPGHQYAKVREVDKFKIYLLNVMLGRFNDEKTWTLSYHTDKYHFVISEPGVINPHQRNSTQIILKMKIMIISKSISRIQIKQILILNQRVELMGIPPLAQNRYKTPVLTKVTQNRYKNSLQFITSLYYLLNYKHLSKLFIPIKIDTCTWDYLDVIFFN